MVCNPFVYANVTTSVPQLLLSVTSVEIARQVEYQGGHSFLSTAPAIGNDASWLPWLPPQIFRPAKLEYQASENSRNVTNTRYLNVCVIYSWETCHLDRNNQFTI